MNLRLQTALGCMALSMVLGSVARVVQAEDWPTWRHDASRTAATAQKLPDTLKLAWTRQFAAPAPAWPEDPKLMFDAAYEPIVVGKTLFMGSNSDDSLVALDTDNGREKWRFFAEGPVRLAPVVSDGRVYFGSDDGAVYCLSIADGSLVWKIPSPFGKRTAIGNDRLISLWPIRGGPVIDQGWLYYTAGVWPFEGAALFRVDLNHKAAPGSGNPPPVEVVTTFTDDSPQGYLAISNDVLFVPTGRGPATCLSLKGTPAKLPNFGSDKRTDCHLTLSQHWMFQGGRAIDFQIRKLMPLNCPRPVANGSIAYCVLGENIVAVDLSKPLRKRVTDDRKNPIANLNTLWYVPTEVIKKAIAKDGVAPELEGEPLLDVVAGDTIVGHWQKILFAIRTPSETKPAQVVWTAIIDGSPESVIAADNKLFVSSRDGKLLCFSQHGAAPVVAAATAAKSKIGPSPSAAMVANMLKLSGAKEGYCILWGSGDDVLIDGLVRHSALRLIVIDPDTDKVGALRRRLAAAGVYGSRVAARVGNAESIELPPYLANLVVCGDLKPIGLNSADAIAAKVLPTLRPYGGTALMDLPAAMREKLGQLVAAQPQAGAKLVDRFGFSMLHRPGALPGAADWRQEYGDAANSLMSQDKLVAAPLGILWFGGPAADPQFYYDRHVWPPSPLIIGGRMILQGRTSLGAVDIYTGRVLWRISTEHGSSPGRRVNFGSKDKERDIGYHMAAAEDAIYLCYPTTCLRIDPTSGKTLSTFELPEKSDRWGELEVLKDRLLVPVFDVDKRDGKVPTKLVALDRTSGKLLWSYAAKESCPLVAAGNGRVYVYDGLLDGLYRDMKRKGKVPEGSADRHLLALDASTGKVLWQEPISMVATWVAHSANTDIVLASNHEGIEARQADTGKLLWQKSATSVGFKGHPESRWDRLILWNDRIIDQRGPGLAYDLKTGNSITRTHPITGAPVPWEFTTTSHNCAYAIASQNMLTFRDGSAGYCNVTDGMTTRLPGFRPGCRSSLIPAGGVLNAPNLAQGCTCGFSVFTSLALVHQSGVEAWSYSPLKPPKGRVVRLGINLGAPGDRLAPDGTLWLDWPSNNKPGYVLPGVAGPSPDVAVTLDADNPHWFRLPTSLMKGTGPNWVAASGVEGIRSLTIPLGGTAGESGPYTVRLVFTEPDDKKPGERVFDVAINGQPVLKDFDLSKAPGMRHYITVREFPNISAKDTVRIELTPKAGRPLLCGVEVVAAEPK